MSNKNRHFVGATHDHADAPGVSVASHRAIRTRPLLLDRTARCANNIRCGVHRPQALQIAAAEGAGLFAMESGMIGLKTAILGLSAMLATAGAVLAQDVAEGEEVYKKCRACHQVGETAKNAVGPKLNGLFGRKSGSIEGFNYSEANKNSGVIWDDATFAKYIADPRASMPGNKMAFAGLKDEKDIKDLTAFLKQFDADGKKK
jgi:cytochrome c